MKLIICIVLAVAAVVAADEGFYSQPTQSAPDSYTYYNYEPELPKRNSWLDRLFGSNRRQGLAGLLGGLGGIGAAGPIIAVVAVVIVVAVGLTALNTVISNINSSGRDLGTDDWEINHSVWMDQLQQEFEDSWETHKLM